jgi:hypothetical protein
MATPQWSNAHLSNVPSPGGRTVKRQKAEWAQNKKAPGCFKIELSSKGKSFYDNLVAEAWASTT